MKKLLALGMAVVGLAGLVNGCKEDPKHATHVIPQEQSQNIQPEIQEPQQQPEQPIQETQLSRGLYKMSDHYYCIDASPVHIEGSISHWSVLADDCYLHACSGDGQAHMNIECFINEGIPSLRLNLVADGIKGNKVLYYEANEDTRSGAYNGELYRIDGNPVSVKHMQAYENIWKQVCAQVDCQEIERLEQQESPTE